MKVNELMESVERLHPNQFTEQDKVRWLNEVEATIYREIVLTHEHEDGAEMPVYSCASDTDVLLAQDPYSRLYPLWMEAQIAWHNHESLKYDAAAQAFNDAYGAFRNWYNRTHMPLGAVDHLHLVDRTWGWR